MSSNSVCNHTPGKQIGLALRGRPILLITPMITDRIALHFNSPITITLQIEEGGQKLTRIVTVSG